MTNRHATYAELYYEDHGECGRDSVRQLRQHRVETIHYGFESRASGSLGRSQPDPEWAEILEP